MWKHSLRKQQTEACTVAQCSSAEPAQKAQADAHTTAKHKATKTVPVDTLPACWEQEGQLSCCTLLQHPASGCSLYKQVLYTQQCLLSHNRHPGYLRHLVVKVVGWLQLCHTLQGYASKVQRIHHPLGHITGREHAGHVAPHKLGQPLLLDGSPQPPRKALQQAGRQQPRGRCERTALCQQRWWQNSAHSLAAVPVPAIGSTSMPTARPIAAGPANAKQTPLVNKAEAGATLL